MKTHIIRVLGIGLALASANLFAALPPPTDPSLSCSVPKPFRIGPYIFYEDGLSAGVVASDVWETTHQEVSGTNSAGDKELEVAYTQAYGSFGFFSTSGFSKSLYDSITLTVRSEDTNDLTLYFKDENGGNVLPFYSLSQYVLEGVIGAEDRTVTLPITDVVLTYQRLSGFLIESNEATTVHLDDVQLNLTTPGLVTLFDDHLHAVFNGWNSSASTDTDAFSGSHSMRVNVAGAWGGQLFHHAGGYSTNDYGALTFAVKSDTPNLDIFPYVETKDGQLLFGGVSVSNYVYGGDITDEWKVVWIPLRDLTNDQSVEIANLYLEFNQPGVVWLDEVKVSRGLEFPLKNGWTPWTADISSVFDHSMGSPYGYDGQVTAWTGEVGAGTPVDSGCYPNVNPGQGFSIMGMYVGSSGCRDKLNYDGHPGIDYVVANVSVNPAAPGKVMSNQCWTYNAGGACASWGAVGVDHGNGFITQYWHMRDIQVQPGQTVTTDTVLGTASDAGIPGALHLHFEVAKRVGSTYAHVDPYGWAGSFDTDPYTKARNVCLWQTGCP